MTLRWDRDKGVLTVEGKTFTVTNKIRNELNGLRLLHKKSEVVNSIVNGKYDDPYMPRQFPKGTWKITGVEHSKAADYFPIKIKTNAEQIVECWTLDKDGGYDKPSGKKVLDGGYLLHWAENSGTTLGCGRIGTFWEAVELGLIVKQALDSKDTIELVVT